MNKILLIAMIVALATTTACSSALTSGDRTGDDAHAFVLHNAQIIDKLDGDIPGDGETFLIIKYEVENLRGEKDVQRNWNEQMALVIDEDSYTPILLTSLENQLWQTSLDAGKAETGYMAFTVPDEIDDIKLTITFPESGIEESYEFRPVDIRISANAEFTLMRLDQVERTKRIPLVGGLLASFSSSPIRYLGTILVPEEEIDQLLADTKGLPDDTKLAAIEAYLIAKGHGKLE